MRASRMLALLGVIAVACAAGTETSVSSPTSTTSRQATTTTEAVEKSAVFDFSAIEGEWSGMIEPQREGTSGRSPVELSLEAEARRGAVVGSFRYPYWDDPCRGTLSALRVDEFEYVVFQSPREGDCNPDAWSGQLRLLYNSETDSLNALLALDAVSISGVLERVDE